MATTTRGIYYPDSTVLLNNLENLFSQLASTADTAIGTATTATYGRVRLASNQTLTATMTQLAFTTSVITAGVTATGSGLRANTAGLYTVMASVQVTLAPADYNTWRDIEVRVNNVAVPYARFSGTTSANGTANVINVSVPVVLAANDIVTVWTEGSKAGTAQLSNTSFAIVRVGA